MKQDPLQELFDLSKLEYDEEAYWNELLLYTSIILRSGEELLYRGASTEYKNEYLGRIAHWCSDTRDYRREQEYLGRVFISDTLPDVCGSCFFSFGLTVSGRYRFSCPKCKRKEIGVAVDRKLTNSRITMITEIIEAAICQLIYKYYSPNGDPSWQMKNYNLWKF